MSGLLPRTSTPAGNGNFTDLTAQSLVVSGLGFISNLVTAVFSAGQLETSDLSAPTGSDLTISTGGSARVIIPEAGIANDNAATDVLALNGSDELVYVNDLVDLTSAQTMTNKTLTAPIISTISNTGTLTLPTSTDTLVGRATTDTLTNKTLTAPVISTISNTGTLTLPTSTDTLIGRATTDTLTNKTIDSAGTGNAITITSGSLSATNINDVLNQPVRTTSGVTFASTTTQNVLVNGALNDSVTVRSTTSTNNQILFQSNAVTNQTGFGYDVLNSLHRVWGYLNSAMVFATNNLERMRIPAGGIANDNTITNMLGLNGTTLSYKNNVVDTSTSQSLTNKDFTNGISQFGGDVITSRGTQTTTDASTVVVVSVPTVTDTTLSLEVTLNAYCTAGANANTGCTQRLFVRVVNAAGTLTIATAQNSFSNAFATALGVFANGTAAEVRVTGIASNTIRWTAATIAYYE